MKKYGDDLKTMLQVGQIRDLDKLTDSICHGRSEWLLRIAPVYNLASLWLSDAAEYARKEGIYRFGFKKRIKTADQYMESRLKEVVRFAQDKQGRKFILDVFDRSEDVMRRHSDHLFYPIFNYLSKLGLEHLDTCAALSVALVICQLCDRAEHEIQMKWKQQYGYTIPLIVDMREASKKIEEALELLNKADKDICFTDDKTCSDAMQAFITNAFSVHMPNTAAGEALEMNPEIRRELDREALREAQRNAD
mgnify:FL=1